MTADRSPTRFVFAHGFTQTARSWKIVEALISERVPGADCVAVDLPGHGASTRRRRDLWGSAEHLVACGGSGTYVGYSMGGRVALHAALRSPSAIERLVLIGATAGIDEPGERAARRRADNALADDIMQMGVARFVDRWLTNPLFDGLDEVTAQRDDRLRNTRSGLASSLRLAGTGTQQPLWDRLGEIACPTLVLVGERDAKFRRLGERLADGLPDGRLHVVADSGHSVHLERPEATADAVADFVRRR